MHRIIIHKDDYSPAMGKLGFPDVEAKYADCVNMIELVLSEEQIAVISRYDYFWEYLNV